MTDCPQCRSSKTTRDSLLDYTTCEYCGNKFYETTLAELTTALTESTHIKLPDFKNPLKISEVRKEESLVTIYLQGSNTGKYRLRLTTDHTGTLSRKKSGSERNQFGSKWTNGTNTWPETLQ